MPNSLSAQDIVVDDLMKSIKSSVEGASKCSLLLVLGSEMPFMCRKRGDRILVKGTLFFENGKLASTAKNEVSEKIQEPKDLLEAFIEVEFYLSQLLKLLLLDSFQPLAWEKLEIMAEEFLSFNNKRKLISQFDKKCLNLVDGKLHHLQNLRNKFAHNPINICEYRGSSLWHAWEKIDEDMRTCKKEILKQYALRQREIFTFIDWNKIDKGYEGYVEYSNAATKCTFEVEFNFNR